MAHKTAGLLKSSEVSKTTPQDDPCKPRKPSFALLALPFGAVGRELQAYGIDFAATWLAFSGSLSWKRLEEGFAGLLRVPHSTPGLNHMCKATTLARVQA